jgi:xylulose-5-phosphate/fructose-6-phosphate phosphoketolase
MKMASSERSSPPSRRRAAAEWEPTRTRTERSSWFAVEVSSPGGVKAEATRVLGKFLRDVMKLNLASQNFRLFGPDETASNRLDAVYEVTAKEWMARIEDVDVDLSASGRVMEVLSEHMCQGWLEGSAARP